MRRGRKVQETMRKIKRSEWACPMITISKPISSLKPLANIGELNKCLKKQPFPVPKVQVILQKFEGFMQVTLLNLNMQYYHILMLTPNTSRLCMVVLPWGECEYLRISIGLCISPDIFQEKTCELMSSLKQQELIYMIYCSLHKKNLISI